MPSRRERPSVVQCVRPNHPRMARDRRYRGVGGDMTDPKDIAKVCDELASVLFEHARVLRDGAKALRTLESAKAALMQAEDVRLKALDALSTLENALKSEEK